MNAFRVRQPVGIDESVDGDEYPPPRRGRRHGAHWSPRTSFVLVAAALAVLVGGSNLPTPLFPLYQREYHFGSAVLTVLFCTYVIALIPSLLTLGRLSDRWGRRPVIIGGLALTACSSLAFAAADHLAWLFVGEALYGVASGLVSSGAAAALRELHPTGDASGSALGASLAPAIGLALGPLISGALASTTSWPTVSPYVFDIILVLFLLGALTGVPETRPSNSETRHGSLARLPRSIRRRFIGAAALSVTAWAITGWILALSPAFLRDEIHQHDPALSGTVAAVFFVASGAGQFAIRRSSESHATLSALGLELAGMCTALLAVPTGSLTVVFIAVLLAGAGHGAALVTAMRAVLDFAPAKARGRVTSTLYVINYIGLGVPVIACGIIADHSGIATATAFFTVAIAAISAISVALLTHSRASGITSPSARHVLGGQ